MKNSQRLNVTIATKITFVRIISIPLFLVALLCPWPALFGNPHALQVLQPVIALLLYILIAATDAVDGHLARSRNEVTSLGKFLDPLADKILVTGALLAFVEMGILPFWIPLIIITRDFIISGLRMMAAADGIVIAASIIGKVKTATQMVAIGFFIMFDSTLFQTLSSYTGLPFSDFVFYVGWALMVIALAFTIWSMVDYLIKSKEVFFSTDASIQDASAPSALESFAEVTVKNNIEIGKTIACAESCTGGLVGALLCGVSGASATFLGSAVTYSNDAKSKILGVNKETLSKFGAVSEETVREMALGAQKLYVSDRAVSISGVAGPLGGSEKTPVGTVCFGYVEGESVVTYTKHFDGDRQEVRNQATQFALCLLSGATVE